MILLGACHVRKTEPVGRATDTLQYETTSPMVLTAVMSRQVVVAMLDSAEAQSVEQWELETPAGLRSAPVSINFRHALARLYFKPISSRQLYQQTGLRGDLDSVYTLRGVLHQGGEMVYEAHAGEDYRPSRMLYSWRNSTAVFTLRAHDSIRQRAREHVRRIWPVNARRKQEDVHLSEQELIVNGLWMKLEARHQYDSIYIQLRVVNQSGYAVHITPDAVMTLQGHQQLPAIAYPAHEEELPDGGRGTYRWIYVCRPVPNDLRLQLPLTWAFDGQVVETWPGPVDLHRQTVNY